MQKYLLLMQVCLWLVACGTAHSNLKCSDLASKELHELLNQNPTVDELQTRLAKIFSLQPSQVEVRSGNGETMGYTAMKDNIRIDFSTEGGVPVIASLDLYSRAPTADEVLQCLGSPQLYTAYFRRSLRNQLEFDLYYLDQGILVRTSQVTDRNQPPKLSGDTAIHSITFSRSVPESEMLDHLNIYQGQNFQEFVKQHVKPWPGNWEEVIIDIDPAIQQ